MPRSRPRRIRSRSRPDGADHALRVFTDPSHVVDLRALAQTIALHVQTLAERGAHGTGHLAGLHKLARLRPDDQEGADE